RRGPARRGDARLGGGWGGLQADTDPSPPQKERDLELAARIGQSLLKQNRSLTERNELLEEQLELAREEVTGPGAGPWGGRAPLRRALTPRPRADRAVAPRGLHAGRPAPLLHHDDGGERARLRRLHAVSEGGPPAPVSPGVLAVPSRSRGRPVPARGGCSASARVPRLRRHESSASLQQYFQYDVLQQKLKGLEEENQKLRLEASSIATETCQYEDQEQQLMIDCVEQFSEASRQVTYLSEELARKTEDTARQQEEISQLLAQVVDLQQKCR
uniref:HAP1 N-terminal domain-containing protein n=1 Tax=Dromaius novaehollandiae TaxID=8790 RepID=A0A8C4JND0_DRONO